MDENKQIKDIQLHNYDEAVNWLRVRYKNDADKLRHVNMVIDKINNNYPVSSVSNIKEKDILTAVWQRTFNPDNSKKTSQMREAMGDAILDCIENDRVVCPTGRVSKTWQSLARLDLDDEIGILKTKQAIRNEIYQRAAKIVDDFVGKNGSASQILKDSYSKNENTEQVKELQECMKAKIDEMRDEYNKLVNEQQLTSILLECKEAVV